MNQSDKLQEAAEVSTALKFVQNKLGENLWQFPQKVSQSTIFEFMEEYAQLKLAKSADTK